MPSNPYQYLSSFPKDFQIVDGVGQLMPAWQYFFQALWSKTGGGVVSIENTYTVIQSPGGPVISGPGPANGTPVGAGAAKGAPIAQSLGTSPWTFHAAENGLMSLSGGDVRYSRDGTTFYSTSMTGGQVSILKGDFIKVFWYGTAPVAVWWPGGF
jgi:hypothetical protein